MKTLIVDIIEDIPTGVSVYSAITHESILVDIILLIDEKKKERYEMFTQVEDGRMRMNTRLYQKGKSFEIIF